MTIHIKNREEIEKMRIAGHLAAQTLTMITPYVQEGVSTETLDQICHDYIVNVQKASPASLGYKGYPKSICTSLNHQVCHGIPGPRKLKSGDILNIDLVIEKDGYHGDSSKMFEIGKVSVLAKRLVQVTRECLLIGIKLAKPGTRLGDIGFAIEQHAKSHHFSVVREYCGHGIGRVMHEAELQVLHYGLPHTGLTLEPRMSFTIEPMINAGRREIKLLNDGWTVVTKDRSLSAQWEHTLLITEDGCEVLTQRADETIAF